MTPEHLSHQRIPLLNLAGPGHIEFIHQILHPGLLGDVLLGILPEIPLRDTLLSLFEDEKTLADTVAAALRQIEEKDYDTELTARGISGERIRHYGFAFAGKTVLIG